MRSILGLFLGTLVLTTAPAQTLKVIYKFGGADGSFPTGNLIRDAAGNFYGATYLGGASNRGVVFKLDSQGAETVLYSFTGATDGGFPIGRLIRDHAGNLYGMTSLGGDSTCSCGTVFKLKSNGKLTTLHRFKGGEDGAQNQAQPEMGLVLIKGVLYGSTSFGGIVGCDGNLGCGVVFKVTQSGKETVLYRFTAKADGGFPQDLLSDHTGTIYAATGGSYIQGNAGTIFKLDTSGNLTTLYTFPGGAGGTAPRWRLIHEASGIVHGVTQFGGTSGNCRSGSSCGVAYTLDSAGKEQVLHSFGETGDDGDTPAGPLLALGQALYGMTFYGGNNACNVGCGTIYRIADNGKYAVLYRFSGGADGAIPTAGLTKDAAGNLYGTTAHGGNGDNGVVFKIKP